jgi:GTP-binding protein LepA
MYTLLWSIIWRLFLFINKIDLPSANIDYVKDEIEEVLGLDTEGIPLVSAKNGINIEDVLERIVTGIPSPEPMADRPLRALIFDSFYDSYKGVIVYMRIKEGSLRSGDTIYMMNTKKEFLVNELGYFKPGGFVESRELLDGEVGYLAASIKNVKDTRVGDTVTLKYNKATSPLPGYKKVTSMVFCGIYPADGSHYGDLRDALEKLQLNDASLSFEAESSVALGFGFRCGFLGLLHMEIIQERIEREFELDIVTTAPSVIYKITIADGTVLNIDNPTKMPQPGEIEKMEEPMVKATIMTPSEYTGTIMELCQDRRGTYIDMEYIEEDRVIITYDMPLNEIIYDFFDALKSRTRGYASFDYELTDYKESKLVKLDILLKGELVDALSFIVHADKAYARGRRIAEKLKETLPKQNFEIPIQASIGAKVIARETVRAYRKDVLAKCYGGDITRKKKLLEKQKEGKKTNEAGRNCRGSTGSIYECIET